MRPQKPFRFLDLPLEVRNDIYNVILCTPPPPELWPLEQQDIVGLPRKDSYLCHPLETQILRVNHQVHFEAKDVMLRGNQFIHVRVRHSHNIASFVQQMLRSRQIPIRVIEHESRGLHLKGFVMTYLIDWVEEIPLHAVHLPLDDVEFMILRRDLDVFCETLAFLGTATMAKFDEGSRHTVEIHNPFDGTLSPDFMSEMNQERLLQPFCDHFRGFKSVSIYGHVSPRVSEAVQKCLAKEPSPEEVLAEVQHVKDLGNSFFRQKEFHKAAAAYWTACHKAQAVKSRSSWSHIRTQGGVSFVHALAELYFQICLNAAQNMMAYLRHIYDTYDPICHREGRIAEQYINTAKRISQVFDSVWVPTLAQMAKANYRMACVQRAMGNVQEAKIWIDQARLQAPSDQIIRREAEEIEAETRARAGLGRLLQ